MVAWLAGCRRLHRRYERKAARFLAFAGIAAAFICYRSPGGNSMARAKQCVHPARRGRTAEPKYQIRAQYTDSTVTVYQAYTPEIGLPAAREGRFRWCGRGIG
jgi:hypothetical protein